MNIKDAASRLEDQVAIAQQFPTPTADKCVASTLTPEMADVEAVAATMWPTPKASAAGPDFAKTTRSKTGISLATAAAMWPTPTSRDWKDVTDPRTWNCKEDRDRFDQLGRAVFKDGTATMWPTPTACQGHNNSAMNAGTGGRAMLAAAASSDEEAKAMAGGALNPTWVEWLMGFPLGWTDCAASETPSYRKSSS